MKKWNAIDWVALVLLLAGGLNWGIIGFFGVDVIGAIFGPMSGISRFVYALVGLSALYVAVMPTFFATEECAPTESMKTMGT